MKASVFALCVVSAFGDLRAQTNVWQPSPGHTQVPIWPGAAPDAQPVPGPEAIIVKDDHLIAGKPWVAVVTQRIGVIGFSAGGHMVTAISTHFDRRSYAAVDAADKVSCRPDFAIALYPGHLWEEDKNLRLNPNVPATSNTPPTFLLQAENDPVDNVNNSLAYYLALKQVGVPVEMHLYAQGGHGFGLRRTRLPITEWPQLVEKWLGTIKVSD